jgi:hypothetical protein
MLPLLEKFWNSSYRITFRAVVEFLGLQYPEIFVFLKQALFLETGRIHSEQHQRNGVGVSFQ